MTYALVAPNRDTGENEIKEVGRLPGSAQLLSTGQWFCPPGGLVNATVAQQRACGWFEVNDTPPAYDDATEVLVRGEVVLIAGVAIREYTIRDKTPAELAADADNADRAAKGVSVGQAVTWLRAQAETARNTTATTQNAVAVLNGVVNNVGLFYDHFADFLEAHRFDRGEG